MKRKTNLFYTVGSDSSVIMFSNYSETLTGSFLSVKTKLFPSAFLCLYAPDITDESSRTEFIEYIASHYENKLACLRDECDNNNYKIEEKIHPLHYLLQSISNYTDYTIPIVSDITEQDYNGSYTDIIMIIDSSSVDMVEFDYSSTLSDPVICEDTEYLYGWSYTLDDELVYSGPSSYKSISPIFDADDYIYYFDSNFNSVSVGTNEESIIKFNIVIPLYDMVNMSDTDEDDEVSEDYGLSEASYTNKVPLCIWFSGDNPVVLDRTSNNAPSWSLTLATQFKPFPYSSSSVSTLDKDATANSFSTFASVLTQQNSILDTITEMQKTILNMSNRISYLEYKVQQLQS